MIMIKTMVNTMITNLMNLLLENVLKLLKIMNQFMKIMKINIH
jgi:hypothetical protein